MARLAGEKKELHKLLVQAQHDMATLTRDPSRESLLSAAETLMATLQPWVGIDIQKSVYDSRDQTGVTVLQLRQNGPAINAGLRVGHVVERVNNRETRYNAQFAHALKQFTPGDTISLQVCSGHRVSVVSMGITCKGLNMAQIMTLRRMASGVLLPGDQQLFDHITYDLKNFKGTIRAPSPDKAPRLRSRILSPDKTRSNSTRESPKQRGLSPMKDKGRLQEQSRGYNRSPPRKETATRPRHKRSASARTHSKPAHSYLRKRESHLLRGSRMFIFS